MARFTDTWRSHLLTTFSGDSDGRPRWVGRIALGDDEGFFGPGSAAWAVHGGMPTLVAGIRALLMQTLHPGAMAGVHDWSRYQTDPLGRLSGTIQWLITVTFAATDQAREESTRVGRYHDRVVGTYVDARGAVQPYTAGDQELLSWVHVVFTETFLACHETWDSEIPGGADAYVREWATAGELVGVTSPPRSRAELYAQLEEFEPELTGGPQVAEAVRFLRNPGLRPAMMPAYRVLFAGAVASIPRKYRRMLGLRRSRLPVIWATGLVLRAVRLVLGSRSSSEIAALQRIDRLRAGTAQVG